MTDAEILDALAEIGREHLDLDASMVLRPDLRLVEDLDLDSLKLLTLAVEAENRFRVVLDEERGIETVGDLVAAIADRLAGSSAGEGHR